MRGVKIELYHDNFQNYKSYGIPHAQLVIADIPYNLGANAYASSTEWYIGGDNKNGESKKAAKPFFNTDNNFRIAEYMHFCSKLLIKEPRAKGKAPAMIVFCSFEQMPMVVEWGKKYGFKNNYPLFFVKNYSAQVLKANMKIVGATEHAVVLYRDKLPKFNNGREYDEDGKIIRGTGKMIFNWFEWERDGKDVPKIHPTQKPVKLLKQLIEIFTDPGDVVIDPVAGSGATIKRLAALRPSLKWACGRFLVPLMAEIVPLRNILPLEPGVDWKLSDGTEFQCFSLVHDVPNVGFIVKVCGETAVYAVDTQYIPVNIPGADLYLIEANYEEHELQDRLEMKLKHGAWAYETSAFARHMSKEVACKWLAENAGPESKVIFLHQHGG